MNFFNRFFFEIRYFWTLYLKRSAKNIFTLLEPLGCRRRLPELQLELERFVEQLVELLAELLELVKLAVLTFA